MDVEWILALYGDPSAAASQLAVKPPGWDSVLPQWSTNSQVLHFKAVWQQAERTGAVTTRPTEHGYGLRRASWLNDAIPTAKPPPSAPPPPTPRPKPRRRGKRKAKAKA